MRTLTVVGNLAKAPELRENKATGDKFYSVSLAEDNSYTDPQSGERVSRVEWLELTLNHKRFSKVVEYLKKGTRATVIGYPTIHTYTNKDKKLVRMFKIAVNQLDFFNAKSKVVDKETGEVLTDDLPF